MRHRNSVLCDGAARGNGGATRKRAARVLAISVPGLVDKLVLGNPRHHRAQLLAHFLDRMGVIDAADGLEARLARLAFADPFGSEFAGLDILQHTAHFLLRLVGDDARARDGTRRIRRYWR